jgi:hypothetical protein
MPNVRIGNKSSGQRRPRPDLLAACLATALGLGALTSPAIAANIVVKACSDSDIYHPPLILFGLRSSVASANDGDTIDMTGLTGCTITLTDGEIPITVNNLSLKGPPGQALTINANYASRIFDHTGTGTVTLSYLSLNNGYSNEGGCIYSTGSLSLDHSTLSSCASLSGYGNAIKAFGNMTLNRSVVTGSLSNAADGSTIEAEGIVYAKYSQINNNDGRGILSHSGVHAISTMVNGNGQGGIAASGYVTLSASTIDGNAGNGIYAFYGDVTVDGSTISNNVISGPLLGVGSGGGIFVYAGIGHSAGSLTITNSTISGNSVSGTKEVGGGVSASVATIKISNSTIAYNFSTYKGGGIAAYCDSLTLQSSIIAGNSVADSNEHAYSDAFFPGCTVTGSNNLVGVLNFSLAGTLTGPAGLMPLANNGGAVKTHALLANSPAINAGNNFLNLATDERGSGFLRVAGAAADIGAYERQPNDDEIFYNGFQ